jgi:hypothetical protein
MQSLYSQWRYRGIDPFTYLHRGADVDEAWEDGREAVLTAFAEHAASVDRAMLDFGMSMAGAMG